MESFFGILRQSDRFQVVRPPYNWLPLAPFLLLASSMSVRSLAILRGFNLRIKLTLPLQIGLLKKYGIPCFLAKVRLAGRQSAPCTFAETATHEIPLGMIFIGDRLWASSITSLC